MISSCSCDQGLKQIKDHLSVRCVFAHVSISFSLKGECPGEKFSARATANTPISITVAFVNTTKYGYTSESQYESVFLLKTESFKHFK